MCASQVAGLGPAGGVLVRQEPGEPLATTTWSPVSLPVVQLANVVALVTERSSPGYCELTGTLAATRVASPHAPYAPGASSRSCRPPATARDQNSRTWPSGARLSTGWVSVDLGVVGVPT